MVIQGGARLLVALTTFIVFKFSKCHMQTKEIATRDFVSFHNIGILLCQTRCSLHGPCVAIEYNKDTLTCRLLSVESKITKDGDIVRPKLEADVTSGPCTSESCTQGMRCLETRSAEAACAKEPGGMYDWCTDDNACYINGSACYNGQCKCTPGLSYHKAEQACVRKCQVYGDKMTIYKDLGVRLFNNKHFANSSHEECMQLCINETVFECLSVEMTKIEDTCILSAIGYLDVEIGFRIDTDYEWLFATRDCETY